MPDDRIFALKRQLASELLVSIAHLNAGIAARVLEIDDARMSDLRAGRIGRFSVERLIRLLATVDRHVELTAVQTLQRDLRWFQIIRERRAKRL